MSEPVDQSAANNPEAKAAVPPEPLADLMAGSAKTSAPSPDLEQQALAAAEAALAEGRRALAAARAHMAQVAGAPAPRSRARELTLRVLLAVNVLAMVVVVLLPMPAGKPAPAGPAPGTRDPAEVVPPVRTPSLDDPVLRAFAAADARDYRTAIRLLEQHLADSPRLDPAKKANVLLALQHYAAQLGDFAKSQDYQRRVEGLRSSHSLPEDLLSMAAEAEQAGDVESMRRHYARLLLQQRQIPSALYRHVAEAYLKLGDSYRQEADQAAAAARQRELEATQQRLREQAAGEAGK